MTATEKVMQKLVNKATGNTPVTAESVRAEFAALSDTDDFYDLMNEMRSGDFRADDIPGPYSRHYESRTVAGQMLDGSWVAWVYWYGGGKHGEPEGVPWMEDAFDVTMREELVTVRRFAVPT